MNAPTAKVVDADRHVVEPNPMWQHYLPPEMQRYWPVLEQAASQPGLPRYLVDGQPLFHAWDDNMALQAAILQQGAAPIRLAEATAGARQLASMDQDGVAVAMLFPTYAPFLVANEQLPAAVSLAFALAYNQWLFDYCRPDPLRLKGVGLISRHDPGSMLMQLQQVVARGWRTVCLRPEKCAGRTVGHPEYEPFWQACAEQGVAVAFHGGTHVHADTAGARHFTSHFAMHACAHPHEAQMAFLALLEAGVLERYPSLKIAFLEAGAGWLPSWLWRLDELCHAALGAEVADRVKHKPSTYFKRQCWIGIEAGEPGLREVIHCIGIEHLLWGSDFPHPDHLEYHPAALRANSAALTEDEIACIQYRNPMAFFGLQLPDQGGCGV